MTPAVRESDPDLLTAYFRSEALRLAERCFAEINTLEDWTSRRDAFRSRFARMLGLDPMPGKIDMLPVVTGATEREGVRVEKLHFQSLPGLYVTGNLFLPVPAPPDPIPGILYFCGHAPPLRKGGAAYGAKVAYHHHGAWFARNGYACLTVDTLQLGEVEGMHHGVHTHGRWDWYARGYTPAGVECWNGIRALDYLQLRPEVDGKLLGVTGRSGGGATSWWVAAMDGRVGAAVPVAGMTDLRDQVGENRVKDHCDCMFFLNTDRWDFARAAALVAPRPLLIANTDKDTIFPLEGVLRLHDEVRRIYRLYGAGDRLGLLITDGPHADSQELQLPSIRWFDRSLRGESRVIENAAKPLFTPDELKVFIRLPDGERNTTLDESFVRKAPSPSPPASREEWKRTSERWRGELVETVFGGWPEEPIPLDVRSDASMLSGDFRLIRVEFTSQPGWRLPMLVLKRAVDPPKRLMLSIEDEEGWKRVRTALAGGFGEFVKEIGSTTDPDGYRRITDRIDGGTMLAWLAPRGVGPTAWEGDERFLTDVRRRHMLLGQTLAGMRVWDTRRSIAAQRSPGGAVQRLPVTMRGEGEMAVVALYAALFEEWIEGIDMVRPPLTHHQPPELLQILRVLDLPEAIALAADRFPVRIVTDHTEAWEYPRAVNDVLRWETGRLRIEAS